MRGRKASSKFLLRTHAPKKKRRNDFKKRNISSYQPLKTFKSQGKAFKRNSMRHNFCIQFSIWLESLTLCGERQVGGEWKKSFFHETISFANFFFSDFYFIDLLTGRLFCSLLWRHGYAKKSFFFHRSIYLSVCVWVYCWYFVSSVQSKTFWGISSFMDSKNL